MLCAAAGADGAVVWEYLNPVTAAGGVTALGDTWQDQEQEKFATEFVQAMRTLKSFIEISDQHAPHLMRKAERIQQYLDQR